MSEASKRRPAWSARRVLSDWQMPECVPVVRLDAKPFVERLARLGVQSLLFTAQSAHGNCLYPSAVGYPNRAMRGDLFGAVCRAARARGLEFIAYVNQTLSFRLAEDHPEWQQLDLRGQPVRFESYPMFCMNCPPYRERIARQMAEITRRYDINGFMLDLNYFTYGGCYCRWCRERFRERFGYALDFAALGRVAQWQDVRTFLRDSRREFTLATIAPCRALKPNLTFTWNHSGDQAWSELELDAHASYVGVEGMASIAAKWLAASGKPFEVWISEAIGDWGDWTVTTPGTVRAMCSVALAHGGAVCLNAVAPPCGDYGGRVAPGVFDLIGAGMKWVVRRERLCLGQRRVPVVGVLHSVDNTRLAQAYELWRLQTRTAPRPAAAPPVPPPAPGEWPAIGPQNSTLAATLLRDLHVPVDFVCPERTPEDLAAYEAIVLPNLGFVGDDLAARLRAYVRGGGRLIATYNTSLLDAAGAATDRFALADLFGADFRRCSAYTLAYLDGCAPALARGLPRGPLQVRIAEYQQKAPYHVLYCRPRRGTRVLARFVEPVLEPDWARGQHIYHNQSPPGRRTRWPAVIVNRYGRGVCAFLPFPLLQSYERHNIWLRPLLANLLHVLGVPRRCQVRANPAVEVVLREDARGWLVHLLHTPPLGPARLVNDAAPPGPVHLSLRPPWPVAEVTDALTRRPLPFTRPAGTVAFTVPDFHLHAIVRLRRGAAVSRGGARWRACASAP